MNSATALPLAAGYAHASGVFSLMFLLVLLPALSAAVLLLGGRRTNAWGHLLGCATPIASFVIGLAMFFALAGRDGGQSRQIDQHLFTWIPVGGFHANANLLFDPLSSVFVLLITGVGSLIHIYSIGYMEHDPDRRRFFAELNLFVATMLTAGVYLIARSHPIYDVSVDARTAVEIVGAVTLVVGAIIGCAYDDIKKVLAASTMSQIGYMMLAVGLGPGAYAIGILHLLTHGFFKANMFLGAGSVMHGMNDEVNMRRYGGLRTVMPITFATFAAGYLAIIGFPLTSGFFSKDKIIEAALDKGGAEGWILGLTALLGAGLTAFYMSRLMLMTFFGNRRWGKDAHPHESPSIMTVPM